MALPQSVLVDDGATRPPRKFTILDAMILVAATAVGLAWNRWSARDAWVYHSPFNRGYPLLQTLNSALWNFLPHLILWNLAVAVIGRLGPRRLLRDKAKQPGMAACWAASLAIFFHAAWYIPLRTHYSSGNVLTGVLLMQIFEEGAFAVCGACLVLAAGGLWQSRRDWTDRVGRMLGVGWIVATFYCNFRNLFW